MVRKTEFLTQINKAIGDKIKRRRLEMGLSRQQLATQIDVSHQQIAKYEKGTNCISIGRLILTSKAFGLSSDYFFEGIENHKPTLSKNDRMSLELMRSFTKLPLEQKIIINDFVRALSKTK